MIVTSVEKIKAHTAINKNISWNTLAPFVLQAETKYLVPILGQVLYNNIGQALLTPPVISAYQSLLTLIEPMVSNFAMYLAAPQIAVHISDMGIQENSSKEGTSNPASNTRYLDARASFWQTANDYREFLYGFLQRNQSLFPDWVANEGYSIFNSLLIRDNNELCEHLGMGNSIGTFLALRPFLKLCEDKYIVPILCSDTVEDLKNKNAAGTLSPHEIQLLTKTKTALAWLAFFESLAMIRVVISDGVLLTAIPSEPNKQYQPLSKDQINELRQDVESKGLMYLNSLKEFLDQNASNYLIYINSNCFKNRKEDYSLPNNRGKKSFGLF